MVEVKRKQKGFMASLKKILRKVLFLSCRYSMQEKKNGLPLQSRTHSFFLEMD